MSPRFIIRLVGGATKSPFWTQMIADATGVPVEIPLGAEFGAKGAALLAATGLGWFPDIRAACLAAHRTHRLHEPDATRAAAYSEGFRRFRLASDALLDHSRQLTAADDFRRIVAGPGQRSCDWRA